MSKHTPGPWEVDGVEIRGAEQHQWDRICDMAPGFPKEDAHLIAAAPELLSLAKRFVCLESQWHPDRYAAEKAELLDEARQVLAKATGEQV